MFFRKIQLLLLFFLPIILFGQSTNIGTPFIQNFYKKDYQGGLQTWGIAQDKSGAMYFANNDGLLIFNGTEWQTIKLPKKTNLRSIAIHPSGKIYAGGQNEIGYFFPDSIGVWTFHSMLGELAEEDASFDDVWDTCIKDDLVLFRTHDKVFIFKNNQPLNHFTILGDKGGRIDFLRKVGEEVYLHNIEKGLFQLKDDTFELVSNGAFLAKMGISEILEMEDGQLLIPSVKQGLFIFDGENFSSFSTEMDAFLKENRIHAACVLPNNQIAIGTNLAGLVILDKLGHPMWHLTKEQGLQNANIRSMFLDASNNLWLGLDNGIDYVKTSSPFQIFYPDGDLQGTAYSAAAHNGNIYFGTSNGLFMRPWATYYNPMKGTDFKFINKTRGEVWGLNKIKGDLFLGNNDGAFQIKNDQAIPLDNGVGTWMVVPTNEEEETMIGGTYTGLQFFKEKENTWQFEHSFPSFQESSRILVKDKDGHIWMSHPYRGVYEFELSEDGENLSATHFYGAAEGLPSNLNNHVFCFFKRIIVGGERGLYYFDKTSKSFKPDEQLNKIFGAETQVLRLFEAPNEDVWFVTSTEIGYLKITDSGLEKKVEKVVLPFPKEDLVGGFEFILPLDKDNVFFGVEKGFIHYSMPKNLDVASNFPVILSQVVSFRDGENLLHGGNYTSGDTLNALQLKNQIPQIPNDQHGIRFTFSSPNFSLPTQAEYRYRLKGFENHFSEPTHKTEKEYTNLTPGDYVFEVSTKTALGEWTDSTTFQFEILPPWYATSTAMVIYLILLCGLLAGLIMIPRQQHKRETKQLIVEHQQVVEQTEQRMDSLRNEKLRAEIEHQNQTLASNTMHLVQKSEILNKLKSDIKKIIKNVTDPANKKDLNRLVRLIDQDARLDEDWNQFSMFFDKVHSDFLKKIRELHPSLTPKDHKMCAYLRMNLSTKEIAVLMNISVRGVEISRYRLRKKMEVQQGQNLIDFLMKI